MHTTLFFFIIPLTAIALNYRGLFFCQEREGDESKIHLKKFCSMGEANVPLVEPTFAKVLSP